VKRKLRGGIKNEKKINLRKHTSFKPPVKRSTIRLSIVNVNLTDVFTGPAASTSLPFFSTSASTLMDRKPKRATKLPD